MYLVVIMVGANPVVGARVRPARGRRCRESVRHSDTVKKMTNRWKHSWQAFRNDIPGTRFIDRYRRRQRDSDGRWTWSSLAYIAAGLVLAIGGLLLVPAPGPGWIVTFFGLGLLGSEFKPVAQALDGVEIRLRVWGRAGLALWKEAPGRERVIIALVVGSVVLVLGYLLYVLIF
jgi:hypothetical protein